MRNKGQISIGDAPSIVLIVGFVFLVMATIAFINSEYQEAFPTTETDTVYNETLTVLNHSGVFVAKAGQCNFGTFAIQFMTNASGGEVIHADNYTTSSNGQIVYSGKANFYNGTVTNVSYTYAYSGIPCNITRSANEEIEDNTSIAGIVLTISLVGIVLSVLIGIFVLARRRRM